MKCFKKMYLNDYCFVFDSDYILKKNEEELVKVLIDSLD